MTDGAFDCEALCESSSRLSSGTRLFPLEDCRRASRALRSLDVTPYLTVGFFVWFIRLSLSFEQSLRTGTGPFINRLVNSDTGPLYPPFEAFSVRG